jgi:hypothetical protein
LGSGGVGQQLGLGFAKLGHDAKIGTRDPGKLGDWLKQIGQRGSVGSFEDAAKFGEMLLICTSWEGTQSAIDLAGKANFSGKVVVDVTNPLDFSKGVPPAFVATVGNSGGEQVQRWLPEARVVKAFNTINATIMCNPKREEGVPDLFIAGNDEAAKKTLIGFAEKWGWASVIDMGDISQAFWLETFAMLWIHYGFKFNNWTHAFKLLRK